MLENARWGSRPKDAPRANVTGPRGSRSLPSPWERGVPPAPGSASGALDRPARGSGAEIGHGGARGADRGEIAVERPGVVITAGGEFILAFGRSGSGPGEFNAPAGLTVDGDGAVYVADFYNHRVQKWQPDASFQHVGGRPGRLGPGALHYPTGVAITAHRELIVADAYNYQLHWFDQAGQPLRRAGYHLFWV